MVPTISVESKPRNAETVSDAISTELNTPITFVTPLSADFGLYL